jgi:RHS repeat-associated protein
MLTGLGIDERYVRAGELVFTDLLGSTVALSNGSTIQTSYAYDPYGVTTSAGAATTNTYQFTGRENDGTTAGLMYYRARYYNPAWGRFVSEDPIGVAGGVNLYAYVRQRPTTLSDPFGLDATIWWNNSGGRNPITNGPTNGNWGGKCWSGGQASCSSPMGNKPPTDSGYACYMHHDVCYSNCSAGNSACFSSCDSSLVNELKSLPSDPRKWPNPPRHGTEGDSGRYSQAAQWYFSH